MIPNNAVTPPVPTVSPLVREARKENAIGFSGTRRQGSRGYRKGSRPYPEPEARSLLYLCALCASCGDMFGVLSRLGWSAPFSTIALALSAVSVFGQSMDLTGGFRPEDKRSGHAFLSRETQAMQDDDHANPGMLWVEEGKALWAKATGGAGKACASCHQDAAVSMKGVAARYPAFDAKTGRVINLEQRINLCRTDRQQAPPLPYESEELLALTAYVAHQSHGMPVHVAIDGPARPFFEAGRSFFSTRRGQLNLACNQCHDDHWDEQLRRARITQGHSNAYPEYRLEWQTLGSLQRRLRGCNIGVRAEPYPYGAQEYVNLELYLAWRAEGLPIETPGVRP